MRHRNGESGAMTLEAMIFVTMFMFIMIILSGLFPMYMMRNASQHALIQASETMALDAYGLKSFNYEIDKGPEGRDYEGIVRYGNLGNILQNTIFADWLGVNSEDTMFSTDGYWYDETLGTPEDIQNACRKVYIAYLGGTEERAEAYLRAVKVKPSEGGSYIDGLDFSESTVTGGVLTIVVKYQLEYPIQIWGLTTVDVVQSAKAKLWLP